MTKIVEFRGKSPDELKEKALELKKELFNLRFQTAAGEQSNTARYRNVRRDIARIKTLLNEPKDAAPVKRAAKPVKEHKAAAAKPAKEAKQPKADKPVKKKASGE